MHVCAGHQIVLRVRVPQLDIAYQHELLTDGDMLVVLSAKLHELLESPAEYRAVVIT